MSYVEVNEGVSILTPSYDKKTLRGFNLLHYPSDLLTARELMKEFPAVTVEFATVQDVDRMIKALRHIKKHFPKEGGYELRPPQP
jgi:hypothetical protein